MAQSPKRIGLIGLSAKGSWASRSHLHYLKDTPLYKVTALQNSSKASAEAAAKQYSLDSVSTYGDPASLAKDPNVDIVAVSVNVPGHYDNIKPALEAGKDVFVEWPLARTLADAEELTELAKAKGVRTLVGLQARQDPSIIKAKKIVESGKLGKILGTTLIAHGGLFGSYMTAEYEYCLDIKNGANLVTIPAGHAVDALCFVLGEMESLTANLANLRTEITLTEGQHGAEGKEIRKVKKTAHDYISITGTLVSGGIVDVTYAGGSSRTGKNLYWEINGTEGSLVLEAPPESFMGGHVQMFQPVLKYVSDKPGAALEVVDVDKAGDFDKGDFSFNVGSAWDAWAGTGLERGSSVTTFEDALVRHKMIDAIYRSAERGTRERYL